MNNTEITKTDKFMYKFIYNNKKSEHYLVPERRINYRETINDDIIYSKNRDKNKSGNLYKEFHKQTCKLSYLLFLISVISRTDNEWICISNKYRKILDYYDYLNINNIFIDEVINITDNCNIETIRKILDKARCVLLTMNVAEINQLLDNLSDVKYTRDINMITSMINFELVKLKSWNNGYKYNTDTIYNQVKLLEKRG